MGHIKHFVIGAVALVMALVMALGSVGCGVGGGDHLYQLSRVSKETGEVEFFDERYDTEASCKKEGAKAITTYMIGKAPDQVPASERYTYRCLKALVTVPVP